MLLRTTLQLILHWETDCTEPSVDQFIALVNIFEISIDEPIGRTILFDLTKKYYDIQKLDCEIIRAFIEKVIACKTEKADGKRRRKIEI